MIRTDRYFYFKGIFARKAALIIVILHVSIFCRSQNPIVIENGNAGSPISEWGVPDFQDNRIAGFATSISVNKGQTVHFKINVQDGASYTLKIYRLGYYAGNGARLMQNMGTLSGTAQPVGINDPVTGLYDCRNWTESASWAVPATAVSGFYIARVERTGGGSNHIAFIVRNDASTSDLFFQIPDATWQAYNTYGGSSLYNGVTSYPSGHAVKLSYNRPFFINNAAAPVIEGKGADWYMNAEYPMLRWLEMNGYDVTYTTCVDVDRFGSLLLQHKVFMSLGHDEYWSKAQRDNVEAARNAGVHLAFFSGNEVYWKTRWEPDGSGSDYRTLVCYKEGLMGDGTLDERACGSKCDNTSSVWTGLWRTGGNYDAGKPENALTGEMSWDGTPGAIEVPSEYKKLRFWRNTSVASLATGQKATLAPNTLGFEWDWEQYPDTYPAGRITMSSTLLNSRTHKLSLYRHTSGALVFGAGTVQWAWGLDGNHYDGTPDISQDMQQATVNLFADMGVQPGTLQSGLVAATQSSDNSAPVSIITSPASGTTVSSGSDVVLSGTATDVGGGVAAGVEISLDNGATWNVANSSAADGTITWNYSFITANQGTIIIKARSFDDIGNMETSGPVISVIVGAPACPCTIFVPSEQPDPSSTNHIDAEGTLELGVKFQSDVNGLIKGIRFYKSTQDTGPHVGSLWTKTGDLLAQGTFSNETSSGWQELVFATPVNITAGTTYVASYHSPTGYYANSQNFYTVARSRGPLTAIASNHPDGPNGVYLYSATPSFPDQSFNSSNYWVDVVFATLTSLPVNLSDFKANVQDNDVKLNWKTSSEETNRGFEIQRSDNRVTWSVLGFVNGAGQSSVERQYSYLDRDVNPGTYYYKLRQVDIDNSSKMSPIVSVSINRSPILYQNYPNPFAGTTNIKFSLAKPEEIRLGVFDMQGRETKILAIGQRSAGTHIVTFNAKNFSPGLYYYRLETESGSQVKKLLIQ